MYRKKISTIILFLFIALFLFGCWDYKELKEVKALRSMGIDKGENEEYLYTFEFLDLTTEKDKTETFFVNVEANNVITAIRRTVQFVAYKVYVNTCEVVVISEEVAKEGFTSFIDTFLRQNEFRISINFFVTKGKKAKDILNSKSFTTGIIGNDINEMIKNSRLYSPLSNDIKLFKLYNIYKSNGISPIMPVLGVKDQSGKKVIHLLGVAVFNKDKLVEYIEEKEVIKLLILTNEIKNIPYTINYEDKEISIEITKLKNKIKISEKDQQLKISYNIKIDSLLVDLNENLKSKKLTTDEIEKKIEETLKKQLLDYINNLKESNSTDTIGIGYHIYQDKLKLWKRIQGNHHEVIASALIDVNVKVTIKNTGMINI